MPADAWVKSRLVHKPARGNVFALLFGAVALTGVLAAVGMQTLTGPVTTITRVTQKNIAETQLLMDARIIINAAVAGTAGGDADTDGFIEPVAYVAAASGETPPTNGGFLPTTLGLSLTDPWGNKYGYCVWDHGSTNSSANRITGDNNATNTADQQPVIALISAGPDRVFQTPCPTYSAGNIMDVQRAGDDIVQDFTYAQASANSNGLWSLNPSDQTKAELKSSGAGGAPQVANVSIDRDTGIGEFLGITTDSIVAKTDTIDVQGGLKLDSNYQAASATCTNAQEGAIRYNSGAGVKTLEVCNGTDWIPAGSDIWKLDGTNVHLKDNANNVGIGLDNPSEKLDVSGNIKASGNLAVGGTADVVGNFAVNTDKFTINATNGDTLVAGNLGVTGNGTVTGTLGVTGAGTFDSTVAVAGDFTINTDKFTVAATSGNTAIAGTLGVGGDVDVGGGKFTIGAATGNTAVAGTLNVTGDTALSANLAVTGNETVSGTLSVTGNTAIDTNTLYVDATANAVGIGTTSPAAALDVAGAIKVGSQNACDAGGANNGTVRYESSTKKFQICVDGTWNSISSIDKLDDIGDVAISEVGTPSDNDVLVWDASNSRWVAKNIAMVGPAQVSVAGVDGSVQFKEGSDLAADDANFHYDNTNNRLGLGTNTPGVTLDVVGAASVSGNLTVDTNTLFVDATNNMVGIGTLAPASALDISGAVKLGTQATCDAGGANDGTLRFNGTKLQLCLSGTWGSINSGGNGMAGDVPDAIDCGTGGYRRVLYLQSTNATQYLYQLVAGAAGIGMQVVYSAADGSHVSTTNTAGWANADGCDGKSFATLTDEGRSFYFMDGQGAVGAGGAPQDATYITQTPNLTLSNEQALSTLATGIVKVTTGTGVLSSGAVDLSGAEATGTLAAGRFPALTGDVTTSAGSLATTIAANAVTSGKIADGTIATIDLADGSVTLAKTGGINTGKLLGRSSAGAGAAEELSVGSGLSLSSGTLSVSGVGASSITPDSLDFTEFKDAMALDASTDIATGAYTLSITNDGTGNSLVVNDNGASDATPFVIDASGNVGIGAPTPVAKLDIVGGARVGADATCTAGKAGMLAWNSNALQVCLNTGSFATISSATGGATASGADGSIQFATSGVLDSDPTNLYWDKANHRLGIGMTTPRKAMDVNGYIVARNRVTFANDGTTTSPIWNIDNNSDTLRIFREPDMSTPGTVYMTINNSGYVGIGPASATSPFHVAKTMTDTSGANYMAYKSLTVAPTADGTANYYADYNVTTVTSDNVVNAVFGQLNGASHTGAGAITNFVGGQNQVYNSGTATVTYGYGGRNLYFNNAAGATTTSAFGADNGIFANVDGPTITNAYGAYNRAVAATGTTAATLVTNAFGAYNTTVNNGTGGITAAYGSYNALSNNDAGAITSAYGAFGTVVNALGGTITNGYGLLGRINNAGTGTITTGKSLQLDMLNSGGGSIGTWYGLYIPAISGTAPTTGRYPSMSPIPATIISQAMWGLGRAAPVNCWMFMPQVVLPLRLPMLASNGVCRPVAIFPMPL
ncbi:MAG: hypothetical protein H6866_02110 [Rhodospirillales bacterium]|nr:MAG: hypothetical protein H6866_02110 [Rhodospirillales bacterium]